MKNSLKTFNLTILAMLAACNGILELTIGSYLHMIKFPMVGAVMVGINVIVYTLGYSVVPKKGAVFSMGIITAFLNLVLGGAFKPWSILAIILEALIIDLFFAVMGFSFISVAASSVTASIFAFAYTVGVIAAVVGKGVLYSLNSALSRIVPDPAFLKTSLIFAAVVIIVIHAVSGLLFSWIAWKISSRIELFPGRIASGKPVE
ncbi:MAG: ECF transporter S component [Firmicutes bacterium]|nr:ECF transporter S component [Bacillota bacterium]